MPSIPTTAPRSRRARRRPLALRASLAAALATALALAGCYEDPQARMDEAQQLTDMVDAVNELNARTSELIFTIDSLRAIVARQDTAIYRLANLAGVPYQR